MSEQSAVTKLLVLHDKDMPEAGNARSRYIWDRLDKAGIFKITDVWRKRGRWIAFAGTTVMHCRACQNFDTTTAVCAPLRETLLSLETLACGGRHFKPKEMPP